MRFHIQPLIESKRDEISAVCRRFHVRRLDVFGSATRSDFEPSRSDVDFLVDFEDHPALGRFETYFGFKEALEELLNRPVDLVVATAVKNPYLQMSIEGTKECLYAA